MTHRRSAIVVRPVQSQQQLKEFRSVTAAYLEWLGEDLSFQQIEAELASLPGSYAAEMRGAMLLAYAPCADAAAASGAGEGLECVGAVALRPLAGHTPTVPADGSVAGHPLADVCEMKRLFVMPGHHGLGAGATLVRALLPAAVALGYRVMVLDTLERLEGANRLYRRQGSSLLGFQPCERYNDCPLPGVLYFARQLDGLDAAAQSGSSGDDDGLGGAGKQAGSSAAAPA
ncbi:hypothetical protein ABPG77_001895 [Micractinium sp. CCAP 211/92]